MTDSLFSINIVTRNRREELKRAIRSVYSQKYRPVEIVVVDNASDDGTPDMVREEWPEIRLIELHRNIGCQPGRNIGMKNCRGKYIFNLDDDGWLDKETLSLISNEFKGDHQLFVVSARVESPAGEPINRQVTDYGKIRRYVANFPGGASAIRTDSLNISGYFPEYPRGHAEADLSLRILDRGGRILYLPTAVMYHKLSQIHRDCNEIRYWSVRHRLETAFRLEPACYAFFDLFWKLFINFRVALRDNSLRGYFRGVSHFIYDIPLLIGRRNPVKREIIARKNYLTRHRVIKIEDELIPEKYSLFSKIRDRLWNKH
ncbi:MAG: glycosyltransferase [Candidatus Auribacterota bacterium]|nr:glycosyltransferase [Candidatus Auribacterota bacterium]